MSPWLCALNDLTNSMMWTPCWPSAGPTGGAGLACPPGAWSLISVRTFLAINSLLRGPRSYLLHLVEPDLHRRLPAEDRHQHLEPLRVLVDLGNFSTEV